MSRKLLIRGGILLTGANAMSALASFLRNIIIARLVSVEDFGIAALFAMSMSIVEMASNLAIDRMIVQAADGDAPNLQATGQAFQALRGLIGAVILYAAAGLVSDFFKVPHATWAFQLLAVVPLIRGFIHFDATRFQRQMKFAPSAWIDAVPQVVSVLLAVPLGMWLGDFSVMVWLIIAQALGTLLLSHLLAERPYRWSWDSEVIARMYAFGWPLLINGLLMFIIFQGDKAIVGRAFSMEVLGWYSAAFTLTLAPAILVTKVSQSLLLPLLANVQADTKRFTERYTVTIQFCLLLGLVTGVGFAVIGPEVLITIFGDRYKDGAAVVIWLGLMQGVRVAKSGPMIVAMALAETKNPMLSNFVRALSMLLAIVAIWLGYSVVAVAIVGLIGEVVSYAISMWLLHMRLKLRARQFSLSIIACLGIGLGAFILGNVLRDKNDIPMQSFAAITAIMCATIIYMLTTPDLVRRLRQLVQRDGVPASNPIIAPRRETNNADEHK